MAAKPGRMRADELLLKKAHESRAALDQQRQQRLPTKGAREAAFAPVP
jgi:hypothetical protein